MKNIDFLNIKIQVTTQQELLRNLKKGALITDSTKAELNLLPRFEMGAYAGIYAFPGTPNVVFKQLEKSSPLPETSLKNTIDGIVSKGGAKWNAPSRITSHSFVRIGEEDFFIASTTLTVSIMKCPISGGQPGMMSH